MLLSIIAAFALPSAAEAADYVGLTVNPTRVAPGWTLSASVTSGAFYGGKEIAGLTLHRTFLSSRGEEQHGMRAHPRTPTISFDGVTGRWKTNGQFGTGTEVDLAIEAVGAPVRMVEAWGCRGAFARVPVRLTGTLRLRTGTRLFQTIRRTQLAGSVTFEQGGLDCSRPAADTCEPSAFLQAGSNGTSMNLTRRSFALQFRDAVDPFTTDAAWYHVLTVSGYDALTGGLPELALRAPPTTVVRGSAKFVAQQAPTSQSGACETTWTSGIATGSFTATFAGWGARTLRLNAGVPARFSESR